MIPKTDFSLLLEKCRLRVSDKYQEPPTILEVVQDEQKSIIATLGNISTVIGKPKSRKSFATSLFSGLFLRTEPYPGAISFRANLPNGKQNVLVVDTEQGKFHALKVLRRITRISGSNPEEHPGKLQYLSLRQFSPSDRLKIVEHAIADTPDLGFVLIDGSRDLLYSFNDERESIEVVTKLMQWSQEREIHIMTVLHQNKNDFNARGHLGSELVNKSESILTIEKDGDFSVIKSNLRDIDFRDVAFGIDHNDCPYLIEGYQQKAQKSNYTEPSDQPDQFHNNLLDLIFSEAKEFDSKNKFWRALKSHAERSDIKLGDNKARAWADYYIDQNFVEHNKNGQSWKIIRVN